ncbi:hypothetical protein RYX45_22945, partial [Alkalihalophilus pseudofirmus]
MRKAKEQHPDHVRTNHRIRKVKEITSDKLLKVWFPVFTVIRDDGNQYVFSEADFDNIEQKDLEDIAHYLRKKTT